MSRCLGCLALPARPLFDRVDGVAVTRMSRVPGRPFPDGRPDHLPDGCPPVPSAARDDAERVNVRPIHQGVSAEFCSDVLVRVQASARNSLSSSCSVMGGSPPSSRACWRRDLDGKPDEVKSAIRWVRRNPVPVSKVETPEVARRIRDSVVSKLDGTPLARSLARQRRMLLNDVLSYGVDRGWMSSNPVKEIKWTAPKLSRAIGRTRVANPIQVRTFLGQVRSTKHSGPRLCACYAAMYFSALRPEEAVNVNVNHVRLPEPACDKTRNEWRYEWSEIYVEEATPHAGAAWTDSGRPRDRRGLKHRERGAPCTGCTGTRGHPSQASGPVRYGVGRRAVRR